jgi:thioredoxin reductase (NADPH)
MEPEVYDTIILGAGPAGLTAAIYTSRAKLKTLVVTGEMVGGQIALTYQVENYPGFPDGVTGPELSGLMRRQADKFGAEFLEETATAVDFSDHPLKVYIGDRTLWGETVIVATGSKNRLLGLESEERLMGRGVFICATCDALLYEGKRVVVVGGGNSAVQEALDLAKFAKEIFIVHRRDRLSANASLVERADAEEKIRYFWDTEVVEILGDDRVDGVVLRNRNSGEQRTIGCDGVLIAIGWVPNTSLFKGQLELDDSGYIATETGIDTSVDGVFICGDINDRKYRQVVTACGTGCKAALEAERYHTRANQ